MQLPLVSGDLRVGSILVELPRGRRSHQRDRDLLAQLADHGARAVHAVQLADALLTNRQLLVTAREEERSRLRRDLHDELGPTLAGLAMQLGGLQEILRTDPATAAERLTRLEAAARHALDDVRRVSRELRPPSLDEVGLVGAIVRAGDEAGIVLSPSGSGPADLPPAVEVAAYRIGVEAVLNVGRHAGVGRARLEVSVIDGAVQLRVSDGGSGLGSAPAGVGILSMRERAEEIGGTPHRDEHEHRHRGRGPAPAGERRGLRRGRPMTTVVLVDDHPMFREGLRFTLERAGLTVLGEAGDGREALALVATTDPDVVVMDLTMPALDGLAATERLVASGARAKILVLTLSEEDASVFAALRAGASGYLVKGVGGDQVVSAVIALGAGNAVFGPSLAGRMLDFLDRPPAEVRFPELTEREREVLTHLAQGSSNAQIADRAGDLARHRPQPRHEHPGQAAGGQPAPGHVALPHSVRHGPSSADTPVRTGV